MIRDTSVGAKLWVTAVWAVVAFFVLNLAAMIATVILSSFGTRWLGTWLPAGFTTRWYFAAWSEFQLYDVLIVTFQIAFLVVALSGLLGVTVLTSMDEADLRDAGYADDPRTLVLRRADQARDAGMGGIVCSAEEAEAVRAVIGPDMALVTPGIRPAGADKGDQKRVMTPYDALSAGASHLVVGRPIVKAPDPKAAAHAILAEMLAASWPANR